jgi:hypothetical protein
VNGSVPSSPVVRNFRGTFANPEGVAVDGSGNVFVADKGAGLFEMLASGGYATIQHLSPGGIFNGPNAITIDGSGNLFLTKEGGVVEVPAASGYTKYHIVGANPPDAFGIAVDAASNVYVGNEYSDVALFPFDRGNSGVRRNSQLPSSIDEIPVANHHQSVNVLTDSAEPLGVAVDGSGNIYFTEGYLPAVAMLACSEPPSLSFKTATDVGTIDAADGPLTTNLENTGNAPFVFSSYPADFPPNASDSSLCEPEAGIAAGLGCDVSVNFMPSLRKTNTADIFLTATQSITLSGTGIGTQKITFKPIAAQALGTTLSLTAWASSGLPVSLASLSPTVCTVAGTTASLIAGGACTIEASQGGGDLYQAASPVDQTFNVEPPSQTVTFAPIPTGQVAATTVDLSATASSGLPVSFGSLTPAVCTETGTQASLIAFGFCTIQASQAG